MSLPARRRQRAPLVGQADLILNRAAARSTLPSHDAVAPIALEAACLDNPLWGESDADGEFRLLLRAMRHPPAAPHWPRHEPHATTPCTVTPVRVGRLSLRAADVMNVCTYSLEPGRGYHIGRAPPEIEIERCIRLATL